MERKRKGKKKVSRSNTQENGWYSLCFPVDLVGIPCDSFTCTYLLNSFHENALLIPLISPNLTNYLRLFLVLSSLGDT